MKVFYLLKNNSIAIAVAFNRGHAVKMLAKELEKQGLLISKEDPVIEIPTETKGEVIFLDLTTKEPV